MSSKLDDALARRYIQSSAWGEYEQGGVSAVVQQSCFAVGWNIGFLKPSLRKSVRAGARERFSDNFNANVQSLSDYCKDAFGDDTEEAAEEEKPAEWGSWLFGSSSEEEHEKKNDDDESFLENLWDSLMEPKVHPHRESRYKRPPASAAAEDSAPPPEKKRDPPAGLLLRQEERAIHSL